MRRHRQRSPRKKMTEKNKPEYPARKKAMQLLERMDRTEQNLRKKLAEKEFTAEEIDDAVAYVKSFHYLDDVRYAETYVWFHSASKSRTRLFQDLLQKGVDKETASGVIEEAYEGDEDAQIKRLLEKKHYDPGMERKEKQRIYAFLMRRGFPTAKILRALDEWDSD